MSDELDGLRSRLESSVEAPAFERIMERAEDTRHRRRATRSAAVAGLAAAAIIAAVFVVAKLPGQEQGPPSAAESPAGEAGVPKVAAAVTESGTIYEWTANEPMLARVPLKDLNVGEPDRLTLRMTARDDRGDTSTQYDATVGKDPAGAWAVVADDAQIGSACDELTATMRGAVAQFSVPRSCGPQMDGRLRWTVTAIADGRPIPKSSFTFVTLGSVPKLNSRVLQGRRIEPSSDASLLPQGPPPKIPGAPKSDRSTVDPLP